MAVKVQEEFRPVFVVTINRPQKKNAVDLATAQALYAAFRKFDGDASFAVAILKGEGNAFCAGADLGTMVQDSKLDQTAGNPLHSDIDSIAPMGISRMALSKPVIAAISGPAVAGGLELALWCDLRVADETAYFGVFCRMRGVPLIDGGTIRLPRLIGMSAASDMILTGRKVNAAEAKSLNLVNYLVKDTAPDAAFVEALEIARLLASHPQRCMRNDRLSMLNSFSGQSLKQAMAQEFAFGLDTLRSHEFGPAVEAFVNRSKL